MIPSELYPVLASKINEEKSNNKAHEVVIHTTVPTAWAFVNLATNEVWRWDSENNKLSYLTTLSPPEENSNVIPFKKKTDTST